MTTDKSPSEEQPIAPEVAASNTTTTKPSQPTYIVKKWQEFTAVIHHAITYFVVTLSLVSARNPKRTIVGITVVSLALAGIGLLTNFNIQTDYEVVYAPYGSQPLKDKDWIDHESGFPATPKPLTVFLHDYGNNVLGKETVDTLFEALETIQGTPRYREICAQSTFENIDGEPDCRIFGATRFWGHNRTAFQDQVDSDQAAIEVLSAETFPGGVPVYGPLTFGHPEREEVTSNNTEQLGLLTSIQSLILRVELPNVDGIDEFQVEVLNRMKDLQKKIDEDTNSSVHLEFFSLFSYNLEFERGIHADFVLIPFVVIIMSGFTCLVFYRKDPVQSRCLLGLCSVAAVGLCLAAGYGIMFIIGVSFTNMSQLLPFVVFGVGLDDCFIVMGDYLRRDPSMDPIDRIRATMTEVGRSIALTSITTMAAFILGCTSKIPAVRWVCIYAVPTVALNFIYQCSFFTACLVLDEERIRANKKDMCFCQAAVDDEKENKEFVVQVATGEERPLDTAEYNNHKVTTDVKAEEHKQPDLSLNERIMHWYAVHLMKPRVKAFVIVFFAAYFGLSIYWTTNLTQQFRTRDFVPKGSYVADFLHAWRKYSEQVLGINVYFRGVNQSDPEMQRQMREYMKDLMDLDAVNGTKPPLCWVMDFEGIEDDPRFDAFQDLSFTEKVTLALNVPAIKEGYGNDIVQDENGTIVASRCWLNPKYLSLDVVKEQIDLLKQQREVSLAQPVNEGRSDDLDFFTFEELYYLWSFYARAVQELIGTTISGIIAVSVIGFVLIEHRTATAFILPMTMVVYIDLLGTLQFAGLHINVVTYVCMVISIGLTVDYLMHVILKYYESPGATRDEKVKETLQTMGSSILVGGFSTFLGVIPLAFSTSAILQTVCIAFFAMVTLGLTHGLILMPVVLSLVGPLVCIHPNHGNEENSEVDNLQIAQNFTIETMAMSLVGNRTSDVDAASTSSDAVGASLAKSTATEEEAEIKDSDC